VRDFYRGYALVAMATAVIAVVVGIVFFAVGILP
jgi:hypothetical protein